MIMRGGRLQKFVLLPFSIRCDSDSSVALAGAAHSFKQSKTTTTSGIKGGGVEKSKMDQAFTKASSFSEGLHRLIRRFKTFSQIFVYKGEMEEEEMEIGFPTDVKHVTHIGLDGGGGGGDGSISSSVGNWEILSFPNSISLHQFELAMAAQSRPTPTPTPTPTLTLPPPLSIN